MKIKNENKILNLKFVFETTSNKQNHSKKKGLFGKIVHAFLDTVLCDLFNQNEN